MSFRTSKMKMTAFALGSVMTAFVGFELWVQPFKHVIAAVASAVWGS